MDKVLSFDTDRVMLVEIKERPHNIVPTKCNCHFIILCEEGECDLELNYTQYKLRKDGMLTIFPFDIITITGFTETFNCSVLILPTSTFAPIMQEINFSQADFIRRNPVQYYDEKSLSLTRRMFAMLKDAGSILDYEQFETVAIKMVASLYIIQKNYNRKNHAGDNEKSVYISRKRELFRNFIKELITSHSVSREVLFYANEMGISSGYLNEICNEVSNHSAKEIIDSAVVARLKYELSYTSKSIQELSDEYNFPSQSYFSRYYRRLAGMTPSEFRKSRSK